MKKILALILALMLAFHVRLRRSIRNNGKLNKSSGKHPGIKRTEHCTVSGNSQSAAQRCGFSRGKDNRPAS